MIFFKILTLSSDFQLTNRDTKIEMPLLKSLGGKTTIAKTLNFELIMTEIHKSLLQVKAKLSLISRKSTRKCAENAFNIIVILS